MGTLDTCHRQKLEGDGSWTGARTLVARSVKSPEFWQWERSAVIQSPEKKRSCKKHPRGAAVQLEEGSVLLSRNTRLLRTQRKESVKPKLKTSKLHHTQLYKSREIWWVSSRSRGSAPPQVSLWVAAYGMRTAHAQLGCCTRSQGSSSGAPREANEQGRCLISTGLMFLVSPVWKSLLVSQCLTDLLIKKKKRQKVHTSDISNIISISFPSEIHCRTHDA